MKLKLSRTGGVMLLVAVVFAAAVLALRVRERAREATFFTDRRDRVWETRPVVVSASAAVSEQFTRQVREAVEALNDEIGCTVLTTRGAPVQVRVLAVDDDVPCKAKGEPLPDGAGAATYVCHDGTTDVLLDGLQVEPRKAHVLIKHELGHALGLDDDPGSDDLMAPHLPDASWQDVTRPLPWLSTKDRQALSRRYCMEVPDAK